jgi:hypothetical protein
VTVETKLATEILGIKWEHLRYAIELSRATDCEGRDGQGHRRWTEAGIELALAEVGGADDAVPEPRH